MINSVSIHLKSMIMELMRLNCLNPFCLGGGTNLALKYNHRSSTDIDLFSSGIVGKIQIGNIEKELQLKYPESMLTVHNRESNQLSWLTGELNKDGLKVKFDVIQNLRLLNKPVMVNEIRLIDDLDIASLKLESMANRGTRKDLYDLVLLTNNYSLNNIFEHYVERRTMFDSKHDLNIFNNGGFEKSHNLMQDLGPLINFNKAKDLSKENNQVLLTSKSPFALDSFIDVCNLWKSRVQEVSKIRNITISPQKNIPARRKKKGLGF